VLAIIPGAETGVELAEMLAKRYGTRSNNEIQLENRRNKYGMQECLRKANIRSVTQRLCQTAEEIQHFFLKVLGGMGVTRCVVKPNESAGQCKQSTVITLSPSLHNASPLLSLYSVLSVPQAPTLSTSAPPPRKW
jgi:hypothetical protein